MTNTAPEPAPPPRHKISTRLLILFLLLFILGAWGNHKLHEVRLVARSASCANDLKQLRLYLEPYTEAHSELFPRISSTRGNIMMDPAGFYPNFMQSSAWVQCEYSDARRHPDQPDETDLGPDAFNDDSFFYLPWELRNEAEGLAYIEAYKTLDLKYRDADLTTMIDGQPHTFPRAHMRSESPVPILVEWSTPRHARRSVLYSDGSVRSMNMGEGFPMTEAFMNGMEEIADLDGSISRRNKKSTGCFLSPLKD